MTRDELLQRRAADQRRRYAKNPDAYRERSRRYAAANRARRTAYKARWRAANGTRARDTLRLWKERNRERVRSTMKLWRESNHAAIKAYNDANRDARNAQITAWKRANLDKVRAYTRTRQANQIKATPRWANLFFIREAYHLAVLRERITGFAWHVDHIVPLRSAIVCGLHVEHNLQVIPGTANLKKGNSRWPDMPGQLLNKTHELVAQRRAMGRK